MNSSLSLSQLCPFKGFRTDCVLSLRWTCLFCLHICLWIIVPNQDNVQKEQVCILAFVSGFPLVVAVCNTSVLMLNRATTIMILQNSVSSQRRGSGLRMNNENGLNIFCLYFKEALWLFVTASSTDSFPTTQQCLQWNSRRCGHLVSVVQAFAGLFYKSSLIVWRRSAAWGGLDLLSMNRFSTSMLLWRPCGFSSAIAVRVVSKDHQRFSV